MRRNVASIVATLLAAGCGQEHATMAPPQPRTPIGAEVAVTGGVVRGIVGEDGLKQYHGIPYAAPPVGPLRWAPPAPVRPWADVKDASAPGPACMQPLRQGGGLYARARPDMAEDCLTLNVWTRAEHAGHALPVMVWIHGGALVTGAGADYSGAWLTSKGVVLVTLNYRLGRFGFMAHPALSAESATGVSGNQGLRDQIAALAWVRDNIRRFGGNADNVTIFGESAGALSVSLLQVSPVATGLFHRVIAQSGGAFQPMTHRAKATSYAVAAESTGVQFANALADEDGRLSLAAIRALPAERLMEAIDLDPAFSNYDGLAIVDGEVIPEEAATVFATGRQADVPVLVGSNADEGTAFLPYLTPIFGTGATGFNAYLAATLPEVADEATAHYPAADDEEAMRSWEALFADTRFTSPMRAWARSMSTVESNAYLYWFTWAPPIEHGRYGAFHAAEIGYVFGSLELFGATPTDADRALSEQMATAWTRFAKTGNPNGNGLPEWPAYTSANQAYMELGVATGAKRALRVDQLALIERAWAQRRAGG